MPRSGAGALTLDGAITLLQTTKESLSVFPPLQSAIGGILAVLNVVRKTSANSDDALTLASQVQHLNDMLHKLPSSTSTSGVPHNFFERLDALSQKLDGIAKEMKKIGVQSFIKRIFRAESHALAIQDQILSMTWSIQSFLVEGSMITELAIDALRTEVRDGFQRVEKGVHQIGSRLEDLRIQAITGDVIPLYAASARFDHNSRGDSCEEGTRLETLSTVYRWLRPDDPHLVGSPQLNQSVDPQARVFWISGLAGTGKSTIAQTVAEWCNNREFLGASFFCSRDIAECGDFRLIFPTIATQLGLLSSEFKLQVSAVLQRDPDLQRAKVEHQIRSLIVEPLRSVTNFPACAIVVDALDECENIGAAFAILSAIKSCIADLAPLKFLITGRPVPDIIGSFDATGLSEDTTHFVLHEISEDIIRRDLGIYLKRRLAIVARSFPSRFPRTWPPEEDIATLIKRANGLFIYAATAIKFIGSNPR